MQLIVTFDFFDCWIPKWSKWYFHIRIVMAYKIHLNVMNDLSYITLDLLFDLAPKTKLYKAIAFYSWWMFLPIIYVEV